MSTRRPVNLPQSEPGSDVVVGGAGQNTSEVVGILGAPINGGVFVPSAIPMSDPNLNLWNLVTTLPSTLLDLNGLTALLLTRLTIDNQGLVMTDNQGNIIYQ